MARILKWRRPGVPARVELAPKRPRVTEVRLRAITEDDIDTYLAAGVSPEIHHMYGGDPGNLPEASVARAKAWYDEVGTATCAWIIAADGAAVGQIRLHSIDTHDGHARLAIGLFSEASLGRGIGRQAIMLALAHGFEVLKLHRIDLRVLDFNKRAIRCYLACGFVHEGTEREAVLIGSHRADDWLMSVLRPEYLARMKLAEQERERN
jgi:RimJ/RimL family protein N-acetyltransferase